MATATIGSTDYTIAGSVYDVSEAVRVATAKDGWLDATSGATPVRIRASSVSVVK